MMKNATPDFHFLKQDYFKGENYENGINNSKVLVLGHQIHGECDGAKSKNTECLTYNTELMSEVMSDAIINEWKPENRNTWIRFSRVLSEDYDLTPNTEKWKDLWSSLAFFNFLQRPDTNTTKEASGGGKDDDVYYEEGMKAFMENCEELQPDKVIVWGKHSYDVLQKEGVSVDERHCKISLKSGKQVEILKLDHPSYPGFEYSLMSKLLREFGL